MKCKCNYCEVSFIIGEEGLYGIPCDGVHCNFGCCFQLDHETYPHGEEVQWWYLNEEEENE